jgi:DNA-binding NtrC family response regulator
MASKLILLVDDEPRALHDLYRSLRGMQGYWDVRCASSGADALQMMAQRPADVVIADLYMPRMDGLQLLRQVQKQHPDALRVLMSGFSDHESRQRSTGVAHQFLHKPCHPDTIKSVVNRATLLKSLAAGGQLPRAGAAGATHDPLAGLAPEELAESGTLERTARHRAPVIDTGSTSRLLRVLNGGNLAAAATDEPEEMLLAPGALGLDNAVEDKKR